MFHLTPQEKAVVTSICVIVFAGSLIHIGQQRDARIFNWPRVAHKKASMTPIDINHAGAEELLGIPGVGPKTTQFILSHRPLKSLEALRRAKGMSPQRYERVIKYLKI